MNGEYYLNKEQRKERRRILKEEISELAKQGIIAGYTKSGKKFNIEIED